MSEPLIRIKNCDGQTRIMEWNSEDEVWVLDSIIMGDFDMIFEGTLKYEVSNKENEDE